MSIETRLRNIGNVPSGGGGGGSSNSAGLAGTGPFYVLASNNTTLPNSYVLQAGANTNFSFSGSNFTIGSNTGGASNSAGLMGTGGFFVVSSGQSLIPNSKILTAGSSITIVTDATSIYVTAITNTFAGSAGLAGTGFYYLVGSNTPSFPLSRILTAGSSILVRTDATSLYIDAMTANALGYVLTSRLINTGFPLSGGSNLAVDLTLTANTAFLVTSNRNINANFPLSGGGNLGGDLTLNSNTSFLVTSNRNINTTFPLAGGGNLGGDLTLTATTNQFYVFHSSGMPIYPNSRLLTAGSSISLRTDSTAIYIDASTGGGGGGTGLTWSQITATTSQTASVNNGYILNNTALVTLTLPASTSVGDIIAIAGKGTGGWRLAQSAGQIIHFGSIDTTSGTGGHLDSNNQYDCLEVVCVTTNAAFDVRSSQGNISYT